MADSTSIRDQERKIETAASTAGKGPVGDNSTGQHKMPNVTSDSSESMCQAAADSAKAFNQGGGEDGDGEATDFAADVY